LDQAFAHFAPEIPELSGINAAHERAHFNRALLGVSDLKSANPFVPFWVILDQTLQFFPEFAHRNLIIQIENDRAEQFRRNTAPILKRLLNEIGDRQNHPPEIPRADRYISESNLFDLPEFAFHHNDVVDQ
jgi:hypothetical protein